MKHDLKTILQVNLRENIQKILLQLQELSQTPNNNDLLFQFLVEKIYDEAEEIVEIIQDNLCTYSEDEDTDYQIQILAATLLLSNNTNSSISQLRTYWNVLIFLLSHRATLDNKKLLLEKYIDIISSNSRIIPNYTWDDVLGENNDTLIQQIITMSMPMYNGDRFQTFGLIEAKKGNLSLFPFYETKKSKTSQPLYANINKLQLYAPKTKIKSKDIDTAYDELRTMHQHLQDKSNARIMPCNEDNIDVKIVSVHGENIKVAAYSPMHFPIEGNLHLLDENSLSGYKLDDFIHCIHPGMIVPNVRYSDGEFYCLFDNYIQDIAESSETAIVIERLPITNLWKVLTENGAYMVMRSANELKIGSTCKIKNIKEASGIEALTKYKCKLEDILNDEPQFDIDIVKSQTIKDFLDSRECASITVLEMRCIAQIILDIQALSSNLEERVLWLIVAGTIFSILELITEFETVCIWLKYTQQLYHFACGDFASITTLESSIEDAFDSRLYEQLNVLLKILRSIDHQVDSSSVQTLRGQITNPTISRIAMAVGTYKINQELGLPSNSSELFYLQHKIAHQLHVNLLEKNCASEYGLETDRVEFKTSIVTPAGTMKPDEPKQMAVIFKAICGLLNTTTGGTLYIGVDNEGFPLKNSDMGIDADMAYLNSRYGYKYNNIEDYCRYLQQKIELHFQAFTGVSKNLSYSYLSNNHVLAIEIKPYELGIVESFGIVYERRNTSTYAIENEELNLLKYTKRLSNHRLIKNVKILKQAIQEGKTVILHGYLSGNSNTIQDRHLEVFQMSDDYQFVWAFDLERDQMVKLFKIQRIHGIVEITNEDWVHTDKHSAQKIDVFNMGGTTPIKVHLEMDNLARTLLHEEYPRSVNTVELVPSTQHPDWWSAEIDVYHLKGVARFCMGLVGHIIIENSPELEEHLNSVYESGQQLTSTTKKQQKRNANMSITDRLSALVKGVTIGLATVLPNT